MCFWSMSVLVLEVVSAWWSVPGWVSQGSRADPCADETVLSPTGWILAQQVTGNIAGSEGYLGTCENRAKARNISPARPSHLAPLGVLSEWDLSACAAAFQVFSGSEPLTYANPAPQRWGGTQSRVTALSGCHH